MPQPPVWHRWRSAAPDEGSRIDDPTVAVKGTSNADRVRVDTALDRIGQGTRQARGRCDWTPATVPSVASFVLAPGRWAIEMSTVATDELAEHDPDTHGRGRLQRLRGRGRHDLQGTPSIEVWVDGNRVKARPDLRQRWRATRGRREAQCRGQHRRRAGDRGRCAGRRSRPGWERMLVRVCGAWTRARHHSEQP